MEEVAATATLVASSCYENHPCGTEGADAGINPVCSSANRKSTLEKRKFDRKELLEHLQHIMTNFMFLWSFQRLLTHLPDWKELNATWAAIIQSHI